MNSSSSNRTSAPYRARRAVQRPVLTAAVAAVAIVSGALALSVTNVADAATKTTTPKLGAKCNNSERGRTTNLLVCSKVGSKISWVKRKNPVLGTGTSTGGATTGGATTGGATPGLPRPLDVIALVNGTGPAAAAIKVDVTCAGLAGATQATQTASFTAQGGTQSVSFNLLDPGADNPTGSTCTATATVSGATPTLRVLVDGRPAAGPASTTVSAPAFAPRGQSAVTVLVDFGGSGAAAPAATTTTALPGPTTTTNLGIVPWMIGATTPTLTAGTGFVTYDTTSGSLRPLASGEYETNTLTLATAGNNVKHTTTPETGIASTTLNSLILVPAAAQTITGAGGGSNVLTITSGSLASALALAARGTHPCRHREG